MDSMSKTVEEDESVKISGFLRLPFKEAMPRIKSQATLYISTTYSDDQGLAKNLQVHSACGRLIEGDSLLSAELKFLAMSLQYRMVSIISQPDEYKAASEAA